MTEVARDVHTLRVRFGRLPTVLVVPLVLLRNFLLGLIPPWVQTPGRPQYVLVSESAMTLPLPGSSRHETTATARPISGNDPQPG